MCMIYLAPGELVDPVDWAVLVCHQDLILGTLLVDPSQILCKKLNSVQTKLMPSTVLNHGWLLRLVMQIKNKERKKKKKVPQDHLTFGMSKSVMHIAILLKKGAETSKIYRWRRYHGHAHSSCLLHACVARINSVQHMYYYGEVKTAVFYLTQRNITIHIAPKLASVRINLPYNMAVQFTYKWQQPDPDSCCYYI